MTASPYQFQLIGADGANRQDGPAGENYDKADDGKPSQGRWKCEKAAEDGVPGRTPLQPDKAEDGGHGAPSPTFSLRCGKIEGTLAFLVQGGAGGQGGNGGMGGKGEDGGNGGKQSWVCKRKSGDTQGGMGGNGGRGGDAGGGGNGGDCGNIAVSYDDTIANPIQGIDTQNAAALGGNPGKPGKGGSKGIGGLSGNGEVRGEDGVDGTTGNIAQGGENGNPGAGNIDSVHRPTYQLIVTVANTH